MTERLVFNRASKTCRVNASKICERGTIAFETRASGG